MSWKRKSPGAHRRRRQRRERRRWSYAYWLILQQRVLRDMGMRGATLQRAARLAARYVTRGGSLLELLELCSDNQIRLLARTAAAKAWCARVTF